jgi:Protein of unknown function (DUF3800)
MLVFVDDSGDPGFKVERGSSSHFVVACVIFDDDLDAEEAALRIKRLRQKLGWRQEHEFKFNKCSPQVRKEFLTEIRDCSFRIRAIVVDKAVIRSPLLKSDRVSFYNFIVKEVLEKSRDSVRDARIRLDGRGDRAYKKGANAYLRSQLNTRNHRIAKRIRFVDSKGDSLIQLADMVAGSLLREAQARRPDAATYRTIIKRRIEDVWRFQ